MAERHFSSSFEAELASISQRVLDMGRLAQAQVAKSMDAIAGGDREAAAQVIDTERQVNASEIDIDREVASIMARRQPAARDLRLLLAASRIAADLERVGDEAVRIARTARHLLHGDTTRLTLPIAELARAADRACRSLHQALEAFAALDVSAAIKLLTQHATAETAFKSMMENLVGAMACDPGAVPAGVDFLFVARAVERVDDHASNLAEQVIYIVEGSDVRHSSIEAIYATLS